MTAFYVAAAVQAAATVGLIAIATRFIIDRLGGPAAPASFGGLCLATGYAIARYSAEGSPGEMLLACAQAGGAAAALLVLRSWWARAARVGT